MDRLMKVSLAAVASVMVMDGSAFGQSYGLVGQFSLPSGTAAWDVGPDGRVWAMVGSSIVRQDAVNGGSFSPVGSVPSGTVSSFGASFLRVNSAGVLAIGDNNFGASARVHFVEATALSTSGPTATSSVLVGNFAARWNGSDVYITGAGSDFVPFVARVTYTDAATPPTATRVISGVGGASGGIDFFGGSLFTGVGFGGGGFVAGDVRSFALASLSGPAGLPVAYGTGTLVPGGPALSASSLAFDGAGRMLVGGFSGGEALVIDVATGARYGLSPVGNASSIGYGVGYNAVTAEALVTRAGVVYRYAIPTPGAAGAVLVLGVVAARRRRGA